MSFHFQERLNIDGVAYTIDTYPLESYLASLQARPLTCKTPFCANGYVASWAIHDDILHLAGISAGPFAELFADLDAPVSAWWFSGLIRGWRGDRRYTGYPSRLFFEHEIVLEMAAGRVVREWALDLGTVPEQTDDELRLALPAFLWPARLRNE